MSGETLTPEQVRELLEGVTAGEWRVYGPTLKGDFWMYAPRDLLPGEVLEGDDEAVNFIASEAGKRDAALIAHAPALARTVLEQAAEIERLRGENRQLRHAAITLHSYSRRYCDGRSTYAPSEHNAATHKLLGLGVELHADPISKTGPFASDGMYGLSERERAALARPAAAEAGAGGGEG